MTRLRDIAAGLAVILSLAMVPEVAPASAPDASVRPEPRPIPETAAMPVAETAPAAVAGRPQPRPAVVDPEPEVVAVMSTSGVLRSPRPEMRPRGFQEQLTTVSAGVRTQPAPEGIIGRRGGLCGVRDLQGVRLSPIASRVQGCGLEDPVQVTSVDGVPLSQPATIDCPTALALRAWVKDALLPTIGQKGGGVARIEVAASYTCRPRNNQRGARISEHGRGRAIDIAGITLQNGSTLTVLRGWRDETQGPILQKLHRAACGPFGTVLGPNSDRFHQNHFHFDTARYRSGPYCR
jgi:hypothetical protein